MRLFLARRALPEPVWLNEFRVRKTDDFVSQFLASRIVFYGGAGTDASDITTVARSRAAHCYVHADYLVPRDDVLHGLLKELIGYRVAAETTWPTLAPNSQSDELRARRRLTIKTTLRRSSRFYVLQRDKHHDHSYGPNRLALVLTSEDGNEWYQRELLSRRVCPWLNVIVEHGFGGQYDAWGSEGFLARASQESGLIPEFALVDSAAEVWPGYHPVHAAPMIGGQHRTERYLYQRSSD